MSSNAEQFPWYAELKAHFTVREGVSYLTLTTFGIGGDAPVVVDAADDAELAALLRFATARAIPLRVIGSGSNLAGMDEPFAGILVRLKGDFTRISAEDSGRMVAGAGARIADLLQAAFTHGLGGLSELAGLPGTLGGALRMNAGANGAEIGPLVQRVRAFTPAGDPVTLEADAIHWEYRSSDLDPALILTAAELALPVSSAAAEQAQAEAFLAARKARQPQGRTAGCAFKNPGREESAGRLIDQAGLKGQRWGAVEISLEHANFLRNAGGAKESDLLTAMTAIRKTVAERFGVYLEPEVQFVDPLTRYRLLGAVKPPMVAVLMGSDSSEREVSLRSGAAAAKALREAGCGVKEFAIDHCVLPPEALACDVVFPVLHGGGGEGGEMQAQLEAAGMPFVGSGSVASALVMDKIATKRKLDACGLPTAPWTIVHPGEKLPEKLHFPVVVKVPCEGSTVGIEKVQDAAEWESKLPALFARADALLVEQFIKGRECTVPVVLEEPLPVVEIRPPGGFYDYDAKYVYSKGHTEYFCPPERITAAEQEKLQQLALRFYREFGCRDMVRVDFILGDADGIPYILEGNSLPGFTATSLVPKAAKYAGISFPVLCGRLVNAALHRA